MTTIVFCHGAFDGGWCWKEPAVKLRQLGHDVYTPTLTGLGERQHLVVPSINLDTHIQDIVNVIQFERLDRVCLVGHSYGGMVVTGVAERIPEKLNKLIYIDAMVPRDGESAANILGLNPEQIANQRVSFLRVPPGLSSDERLMPHPIHTFLQPLTISNPLSQEIPRIYVACTQDKDDNDPYSRQAELAKMSGWVYFELVAGHNPHIEMLDETVQLLDQIVGQP